MNNNYFYNWNRSKLRMSWTGFFALLLMLSFGINALKAQVSGYQFSQTNGSFTSISGATVLGTATANSGAVPSLDTTSFPVTLPFGFNFNNQNFTDITMSSNGYITFGTGSATGSSPISSTVAYDGAVSAWGRDINAVFDIAGKTGNMSWAVEGTAPNRVAVLQWENFRPTYNSSTTLGYAFSFQIRLAETTNVISVVYSAGGYLAGTTAYTSTAQIGLRGATNGDFNNRLNPTTVLFDASTTGTANNSTQAFSTTNNPPGMAPDGLTYTWTPPTCFGPTALTISNITTTTADLAWTAPAATPTNGYEVYYSTSSTSPTASTIPNHTGVSGLSQNLTGLSHSTTYYVWVRSACSTSDKSNWTALPSFVTTCTPITYMYENFDNYTASSIVPNCWARIVGTGTQTINTTTPNSSPNNLYQYSSSTTNATIVVLPEFSNINAGTHWLRLKARVTTAPRTIEFGYVTNPTDASTFVLIEAKNITNTAYTAVDSEYTIAVPTTVPANARLAIRNPGTLSTTLYYDDVYWEPAPSCLPPASLAASNITTTAATISWNASISTPANGYDVYYSTTNVAPTSTSTPNHTNVAGLSQGLSGLSAATVYYVWVRSVCSSIDSSSWAALGSFTTPCNPVTYMYENFDTTATGSVVPACWDRIVSGAGSQTVSVTSPNSSPNNLYLYSTLPANQTIVVLPPFSNIAAGTNWLRMKARVTTAPRDIEFGYVTDPANANTFVLLETKSITNIVYTALDSEYTFQVPTSTPSTARLAIRNSGTVSTTLYIDDVYWETAPTCFPPTNIVTSNATPTGIDVSWTASTTPPGSGYDVYYSTTNTAPTAATVPNVTGVMGLSTTLTGLNPSTGYFVWVRSKCSSSDFSAWSTIPSSVTTACQPPSVLGTTVSPNPVCVGGTATLTATSADPGATFAWYADATSTTPLASTASYTSPVLTATTNYYVTAATASSENVGPISPAATGTVSSSNYAVGTYYQIFDVISPTTLISVDVYPVATVAIGTASSIEIRNSAGTTLYTKAYSVAVNDGVTPQTVTLDFPLSVGTGYRIGQGTAINLNRNTTGAVYPYTSNSINITGNNFSSGPTYWYYIYNWNISAKCESQRTMVTAIYDSTCNLGTSEIADGKQITVFPNPFTDVLNISDIKGLVSVSITDMSGRTVKTIDKPSTQLHLGELQSGMYLVNLKYKDGSVKTVKAIKK